ncbi:hypothetical protein D3C73_1366890 [compost metagenome]
MRRRKLLLPAAAVTAVLAVWTAVELHGFTYESRKQEELQPPPVQVEAWVTTADQSSLLAPQAPFFFSDSMALVALDFCL